MPTVTGANGPTCAVCGGSLQLVGDLRICPQCAMQGAIAGEESTIAPGRNPASAFRLAVPRDSMLWVPRDLRGSDSWEDLSLPAPPLDESDSSIRGRITLIGRHWLARPSTVGYVVLAFIVLATAYTAYRIADASNHVRMYLEYDEGLAALPGIYNDRARFGFAEGDVIRSANGAAVTSRDELERVIQSNTVPYLDITARDSAGREKTVVWTEVPAQPAFDVVDGGGGFVVQPRAPLEFGDGIVRSGEVPVRVVGLPIGVPIDSGHWSDALSEIGADWPLTRENVARLVARPTMRLSLESAEAPGVTRELVLFVLDWRAMWVRLVVGFAFALVGWGVFRLKPYRYSTAGFIVFTLQAGLFWLVRAIPYHYRLPHENSIFFASFLLLPTAAFILLLTFTSLRKLRRPGLLILIVFVATAGSVFAVDVLRTPQLVPHGLLGAQALLISMACSAGVITSPILGRVWMRLRRIVPSDLDIQRDRTVFLASILSFVPTLVYLFIRGSTGRLHEFGVYLELSVLLFPVIIGYAIIQQNLLHVNDLLRLAALYALLTTFTALVFGAVVVSLGPIMERVAPGGMTILPYAAVALAVALTIPLHNASRRWLRRRILRSSGDLAAAANEIDESLQRHAGSFNEYAARLNDVLQRSLLVDQVSLVLYDPPFGAGNEPREDGRVGSPVRLRRCRTLLAALANTPEPILDSIEIDPEHPRSEDFQKILAIMRAERIGAVLPMHADVRLIGALAVGRKLDGNTFGGRELNGLRSIADRVALSLALIASRRRLASTQIASAAELPDRLGEYKIESELGRGGTSVVYLGIRDGGRFAIKVPRGDALVDAKLIRRFRREGIVMSYLASDYIVRVFEVFDAGDVPCIVEEYFERGTMGHYLDKHAPVPIADAVRFTRQIAQGLLDAQRQGVIHRDVKPGNVFVSTGGDIKIGDFGFARRAGDSTLTTAGEIFGTPHYMAPEILRGDATDWHVDQYALGVMLWNFLTGRHPYDSPKADDILFQHISAPIPDLRAARPDTPEALVQIACRMLAKKPDERYDSYDALVAALDGANVGIADESL